MYWSSVFQGAGLMDALGEGEQPKQNESMPAAPPAPKQDVEERKEKEENKRK